jgi:phosphoribosylformimino-5-aminoimidazole carboxamide ribotide isomerase
MFEILPAIDLRDGKCVRLLHGDYSKETIYGDDPVQMARKWESLGATRLHVVDLDGAKEARPVNHEVVAEIARALSIPVHLGGGLRTRESIAQVLESGVARAIIGTRAIENEEWAREMFAEWGERLILGLDAREGRVATAGWLETSSVDAVEFAQRMQELGCRRINFTDIGRDGTLSGPNLPALEKMASSVQIPVVASGGVHVAQDVRDIRRIPNIEGVIVGKALYENTATMPDLLAAAKD